MVKRKEKHIKKGTRFVQFLISITGSIGFFFSFLAWVWLVILLSTFILYSPASDMPFSFQQPSTPQNTYLVPLAQPPLWLSVTIGVFVTICFIGLTVWLLIKTPKKIVTCGNTYTRTVARTLPSLLIKEEEKKREKRPINIYILYGIKIVASVLPIGIIWIVEAIAHIPAPLSPQLYTGLAATLGVIATLFFLVQFSLVSFVKRQKK